ncbi:hypothetical protein Cadr_000008478 [Camelus dromedarius]|uniref:Uncharacterized protein n=1 Tax=Camelus dromedarius TaxID=9838 RepID=A0A5N4DZ55_CAMDR|nr:hypothetical protein Cadr_000008478 [Camelus dromedarius]
MFLERRLWFGHKTSTRKGSPHPHQLADPGSPPRYVRHVPNLVLQEVHEGERMPTDFIRAPRSNSLSTGMLAKQARPKKGPFRK